jgi:hypothetical protein
MSFSELCLSPPAGRNYDIAGREAGTTALLQIFGFLMNFHDDMGKNKGIVTIRVER